MNNRVYAQQTTFNIGGGVSGGYPHHHIGRHQAINHHVVKSSSPPLTCA
jgi:hypothetical protein